MKMVEDRSKGAELDAALSALAGAEKAHGRDNKAIVAELEKVAAIYSRDGLYEKATLFYKRLADITGTSCALSKLASVYLWEGKFDDAEAIYLKSLAVLGEAPESKREVAQQLACLAGVYAQKREFGQAENALTKAAQLFDQALGSPNNFSCFCHIALAAVNINQGKNGEADAHIDKSTATASDTGEGVTDQRALLELAQEYFKQTRFDEVDLLLAHTIYSDQLLLWPEHPRSGQAMHDRGELFLAQTRYADAEKAFKRALDIRCKSLGQAHPEVAQTAMSLAAMYVAQGRFADAEPVLKQAMKTRVRVFGVDHPSVAAAIETYVSVLKNTKRQSIAVKLEARARDIRTKLVWHSERASASGRPPSS